MCSLCQSALAQFWLDVRLRKSINAMIELHIVPTDFSATAQRPASSGTLKLIVIAPKL